MGYVSGSTVVEMSYIMPLILLMFVLIIHTVFYFYDRAVLNGAAAETAVLGAELERRHGAEEENLKEFFEEDTECFAFLAGHESFAAAEGAIGIAEKANKVRKKPLRVILNGLGKDAAQIIARINGFTYVETELDYHTGELKELFR